MMDNFLINDVLLTPEIVMTLSARVCEGQSRVAALPGDSPSLSSFTSRVYDAFKDGDYTSSPAWTVESGTWSAATGALVPVPQSGARAISTANTYGNADIWYAFKRTGTGGWLDNSMVQLRYVDENNWLGIRWFWGILTVVEKVSGVEQELAYTVAGSFAAQDVWYDVYVQMDGSSVVLFACERGDTVQRLLETTTSLGASTSALRVRVSGVMPFEFDDFRVCSRSIHAGQSMVFTYGPANQLATMTTSGVTSSYTYDPWGRLASRSATIGGQSYTATYTYRFGDKLQRIDSNFPGETPVVLYNYDGLGKRRLKAIGNDTTYWRWDAGYSVLAQYQDTTPDWGISGFDRFFVPFGHTALAEADLDASGVPANAVYTYLAQDHLGTSLYGFNQSKTVVSQNVHLPFGQRSYVSGNSPYHEFTGKPWDTESQMYYFPYRYYSPNMNRWTMPDPMGLIDGPNVYGYVKNAPIRFLDKLGFQFYPPLPPPTPIEDLQGCEDAAPVSADSGICSIYGAKDSFLGFGARCVCENAGESDWDKAVRGCLACAKKKNIPSDKAHDACYRVANEKYGWQEGVKQKLDIAIRLTAKCFCNKY